MGRHAYVTVQPVKWHARVWCDVLACRQPQGELALKWRVLVALYQLSRQDPFGHVSRDDIRQRRPDVLNSLDAPSTNRNIISELKNPRNGDAPFIGFVPSAKGGVYELTATGIVKAQGLMATHV